MKTIEEKAKAYDEALEKAKAHINSKGIGDTVDLCKHLFPQLRKSEDERIGNVLYCIVRDNKEVKRILEGNGISVDATLAYLEKQKKQNLEDIEDETVRKYMKLDKFALANMLAERDKTNAEVIESIESIEKQPAKCSEDERIRKWICALVTNQRKIAGELIGEDEARRADAALVWLEKQKEQKPTEWSKFDTYMLGGLIRFLESQKTEESEAKDPSMQDVINWLKSLSANLKKRNEDVAKLCSNEWSEEDEHCMHQLILFCENCMQQDSEAIRCSTWLKSLPERFNLQPKQEWREEYREEDLRTRFAFYTYKDEDGVLYLSNVFVEEASRNKGFGTKILKAAEKVAETIGAISIRLKVKQNSPANDWYRRRGYGYMAFEGEYDWLEKNLEYLKPIKSAEWNEEDETALDDLMWCIEQARKSAKDENDMGNIWFAENWVKKRIKSFRPQPKQEWSEEDEELKRAIIDNLFVLKQMYKHPDKHPDYNRMIEWLKSLRPSWKPSEEQLRALERTIVRFNSVDDIPILTELRDKLKKLT